MQLPLFHAQTAPTSVFSRLPSIRLNLACFSWFLGSLRNIMLRPMLPMSASGRSHCLPGVGPALCSVMFIFTKPAVFFPRFCFVVAPDLDCSKNPWVQNEGDSLQKFAWSRSVTVSRTFRAGRISSSALRKTNEKEAVWTSGMRIRKETIPKCKNEVHNPKGNVLQSLYSLNVPWGGGENQFGV